MFRVSLLPRCALVGLGILLAPGFFLAAENVLTVTAGVQATVPADGPQMFGVNFGPYLDGQSPYAGDFISESQLRDRMTPLVGRTEWIRTFSMADGLEKAGAVAHSLGLKAALGAWLGPEDTSDGLAANQANIANLIAAAQRGEADLLIVGSEVQTRTNLTPARWAEYITQVKTAVPGIPVAAADRDTALTVVPLVRAAADIFFANFYPYWDGKEVTSAVYDLHSRYGILKGLAGGKPVYVSEAGWPSCGDTIGYAVPSSSNAAFHFLNVQTWAKAENIPTFYFEAFDESWKADGEGPQGACWGIWDKNAVMKPGMQAFYDGQTMANNWSNLPPPGGPGTPSIQITSVPVYNTYGEASGRALHINPADHWVALVIKISAWYSKPYEDELTRPIEPDGSWAGSITTGGADPVAAKIRVYLFPRTYTPPYVNGNLPAELDQNALAVDEVYRTLYPLAVVISTPVAGTLVTSTTTVKAVPQSKNGITDVTFSVDGKSIITDSFEPFQFVWDPLTVPSGAHILGATVFEITGASVSASIPVTTP